MHKSLAALFLLFSITASAYPQVPKELDLSCAMQTYGLRVKDSLDQKVEDRIHELDGISEFYFHTHPKIIFGYEVPENNYETAGFTVEPAALILFNPLYLNKYQDYFVKVVVRHEYAHALTFLLFGSQSDSHGKAWRQVMNMLGDPNPQQYHTMTLCFNGWPNVE